MAPPLRVDTEIPVKLDEREDLQGKVQNSPERREACPTPVDARVELGTSRDDITPGRHAASLEILTPASAWT